MATIDEPVTLYGPNGTPVRAFSAVEENDLRAAGYGDQPPTAVTVEAAAGESGSEPFDPSEHKVDEVQKFIREHPDAAEAVIAAERQGQNRTSITG